MKALIALVLLIPSLAFADVSVPRSKQYLWTQYDVSRDGGASVAHNLGASLPAGAIITDIWVYIDTAFTASGPQSLGFQCAGTLDLMANNSMSSPVDRVWQAHLGINNVGSSSFLPSSASVGNVVNLSQGFGSIGSDCAVMAVVRGDPGFVPYNTGKATLIVEYFRH